MIHDCVRNQLHANANHWNKLRWQHKAFAVYSPFCPINHNRKRDLCDAVKDSATYMPECIFILTLMLCEICQTSKKKTM